MRAEDVIEVLDLLDGAGVRHWAGGGWGVAALAELDALSGRGRDGDRCREVSA